MSNQPIKGITNTGSELANSPYGDTAEQFTNSFNTKTKSANPYAARNLSDIIKTYPLISPGVATGLALSGISAKSKITSDIANIDAQSQSDKAKQETLAIYQKVKEDGKNTQGSTKLDFLAPVTRGLFAGLSFPFEFIESIFRNSVNKGKGVNPLLQTQVGQIGRELINEKGQFWKVSSGRGFFGLDPTTETGKALKEAQIASSAPGAVRPWTYGQAASKAIINSGVFGEVEDKTARTIEGIVSFATNILLDPVTYIPGVGLVKIKEAKKLRGLTETKKNLDEASKILGSVAEQSAKRSTQIGVLEGKVLKATNTIRETIKSGIKESDDLLRLENQASRLDGMYGIEYSNYRTALSEYIELRKLGQSPSISGAKQAAKGIKEIDQTAIKAAEKKVEDARQALISTRSTKEELIKSRTSLLSETDRIKGKDTRGLEFATGLTKRSPDGKYAIDLDRTSKAILGGRLGEDLANIIADMKDEADIWKAFGGKISIQAAKELADAPTTGDVLMVIGKNIGLEFDGKIGLATTARLANARRAIALEPSTALDTGSKLRYGRSLDMLSALDKNIPGLKASTIINNPLTRFMPRGALVSLDDGDALLVEIDKTMGVLKVDPRIRTNVVRSVMQADNAAARFDAVTNGIDEITESILLSQGTKLTIEQKQALKSASRIFNKNGKTNFTAQATGVPDAAGNSMIVAGNSTDVFLDSQMTYAIKMPDVIEMRKYVTSLGNLLSKNPSVDQIADSASKFFDSTFKQLVLVGRVSYIARNLIDTQTRQFLSGGITLFNHPLSYIGMIIGNPQGNSFARTMAKFSRYDKDVLGNDFRIISESFPGFDREALLNAHELAVIMGRTQTTALSDMASKKLPTGMKFVYPDNPKFNEAWAASISVYRNSELAQFAVGSSLIAKGVKLDNLPKDFKVFIEDAIKSGKTEREALIDYFYVTEKGTQKRKILASLREELKGIVDDTPANRESLSTYFDDVRKGVDNLTAGNSNLLEFIAGGKLAIPSGSEVKLMSYDAKEVAKVLKEYRKDVNVEQAVGMLKVYSDELDPGVRKGWNTTVKSFFRTAARIEARAAFGPEFRHQYWIEASKRIGLLKKSEAQKALAIAERELQGLRIGGKNIGLHPALRAMRSQVRKLDERGITLNDFDDIIRDKAADNISKLFYDAANKKEWAAATRILLPFGQAWSNTLATWGKMIATNPIADYKAINLYDWFNKPESSFIYDWVGDNWYDPSQGFIFTDPQRGEKRFIMPFAGDFLGGFLSAALGSKVPSMPGFASVSSMNVAFQTELLPGVGPAVSTTVGRLLKDQEGWWADTLREIVYPFGLPEGSLEGTAGQYLPAWAQRISYGLGLDFFEGKNLSTLKPLMAYLASTGNYGDMPLSQEAQNELLDDAAKLNRYLALWRGITQNVSPANIQPQILAKDKDGTYHVQSMMYNEFAKFRLKNPDDYGIATANFADAFGDSMLFSLVSNTSGAPSEPTTEAWKFYSNNREVASKYPEAFAFFFPGGEYSNEYALWQERRGQSEKLTPQEMVRLGTTRIYSARKARLEEKQKVLLATGWDPRDAREWYSRAKDELDAEFGGAPELRTGKIPTEQLINQAISALREPEFAETDAGKGLARYLTYRDKAYAAAEVRGYKSLNGKNVRPIAEWLNSWANVIIRDHNDFSIMYMRLFESETDER
jgi:hypothetical protein